MPPQPAPTDPDHARDDAAARALDEAFEPRLQRCRDTLSAGAFAEGEALAKAVAAEAEALGAWRVAAKATLMLAKLMANLSHAPASIEWGRRSVACAQQAGDTGLEAAAWVVAAGALAETDQPAEALDALGRATALVDESMPRPQRRSVFTGVSITYNALGLPRLALPAARRAFEADRADGVAGETMRARWNLMVTGLRVHEQLLTVDTPAAAALLDELLQHTGPLREEARAAGNGMAWAGACHIVGAVLRRARRLDEAVALLSEAVQTPTEETAAERRDRWAELAQAQQEAGLADAATASAREAMAWHGRVEEAPGYQDLAVLSELHALLGRPAEALDLHRRYHARVVHNIVTVFDRQVADLTVRLGQRTLALENVDLRERYAALAREAEQLGHQARTDVLTGVLTRRALGDAFEAMARRQTAAGTDGGPGAMLVVDLDHFKRINDQHSHLVGDAVLRAVGGLLAGELRLPDAVGRYGGEEFVVLLAGVDARQALRVAERLLQAVRAHDWERVGAGLRVTFSAGLVALAPGETFDATFARADALLYQAKAQGRNRIVTA